MSRSGGESRKQGLPDVLGSFPLYGSSSSSGTTNNAPAALQSQQQPQQQPNEAQDPGEWNDPWALYGGNIAAACRATNEEVVYTRQEETNDDQEKQRQRASNRLTAWQSRERKRIEFEVMQERKTELSRKNETLRQENEQLRRIIQRVKAARDLSSTNSMAVASRMAALHSPSVPSNMPRLETPGGYFFNQFQGAASRNKDLSTLSQMVGGNLKGASPFLFQNGFQNQKQGNEGLLAPTVFAPLPRNGLQGAVQQLPMNDLSSRADPLGGFDVPLFRTMMPSTSKRKTSEGRKGSSGSNTTGSQVGTEKRRRTSNDA